jgi:hypothetical protein
MDTRFEKVLSEDEQLAIDILEKAGWNFMSEITVEKATPVGERWPLYTSGGEFKVGVLKQSILFPAVRPPQGKVKGKK